MREMSGIFMSCRLYYMGLVGKKQRMVKFSTVPAVPRGKRAETKGACAMFGFSYGTDVNLFHTLRVP